MRVKQQTTRHHTKIWLRVGLHSDFIFIGIIIEPHRTPAAKKHFTFWTRCEVESDLQKKKKLFLGATKHLHNWLCPSVGRSVGWSVGRLVGWSGIHSTIHTSHLIGLLGLVFRYGSLSVSVDICHWYMLRELTQDVWMNEWVNEWMSEWMNERMISL